MGIEEEINFITENQLNTPVAFYSEPKLLDALSVIKNNVENKSELFYALKSCYNPCVLKALSDEVGAEVMSELEYTLAKQAGFKRVIINGLGRSKDFLNTAVLDSSDNIIIIDTKKDLNNVKEIVKALNRPIKLGIRIKVDSILSSSNYYSDITHKLGMGITSSLLLDFMKLCESEQFEWEIIHAHFNINETKSELYKLGIDYIYDFLHGLSESYTKPKIVDLGGGFEVYDSGNKKIFEQLFRDISEYFYSKFNDKILALEPGRFLSGNAGYTVGRVLDTKTVNGKKWIITDIGTNTLIPIPNARYTLVHPSAKKKGIKVGITDGITSPSNNVIEDVIIDENIGIGDYICVGNTGAYTDVYSTFWAYNPHLVVYKDGKGDFSVYRSKEDIMKLKSIFFKF